MADEAEADVGVQVTADTAAALDDVSSRFLLNLPEAELSRVDRLFFQLQQAHWFYEDFYVDDEERHIPHLSWEPFTKLLFNRCPLLVHIRQQHKDFFSSFRSYVKRIPTFGVILLDRSLEWVLLVQPYRGNSWGFPKGKANQDETPLDCAIREGFEETGYDARRHIRPSDYIVQNDGDRKSTLFIATGVPVDFPYAPRTRKEVSKCQWHRVADIPLTVGTARASRFWSCRPVLFQLVKWLQRRQGAGGRSTTPAAAASGGASAGAGTSSNSSGTGTKALKRSASGRVPPSVPRTTSQSSSTAAAATPSAMQSRASGAGGGAGSASAGVARKGPQYDDVITFGDNSTSWSVSDMFRANERLLGRKFTYDGSVEAFSSFPSRYVKYTYDDGTGTGASAGAGAVDSSVASACAGAGAGAGTGASSAASALFRGGFKWQPTAAFKGFAFDTPSLCTALDRAIADSRVATGSSS
jgi:8-oxo-dGTP pyrophosphatase MutT (NUDIX family)